MELKTVIIDSAERIFLDGEELQNVTAYKLKHSADSEGPAELTVTMYVNVGQVCSEPSKWSLSADKITEAVRKCLKEELRTAGSVMDKKNEEHVYVSERITNISELERIIEKERNALSMLLSQLEKEDIPIDEVRKRIKGILQLHNQASSFEFHVERRKTTDRIS